MMKGRGYGKVIMRMDGYSTKVITVTARKRVFGRVITKMEQ